MKPLKIFIELNKESLLNISEVKYVFKTLCDIAGIPWHFINKNREKETDITYSFSQPENTKLWIKQATKQSTIESLKSFKSNEIILFDIECENLATPVFSDNEGNTKIFYDMVFSSFLLLTGGFEKAIVKDRWDRHQIKDVLLYQQNLLHTPIIDGYVMFLKNHFEKSHSFVPKWPNGSKVALALSHDTDYPEMIKPIEALRYTFHNKTINLKKIIDILKGKESFWRFHEWVNIEESFGFKSAFYMCSFKGNLVRYFLIAPDTFYDIRKSKFKEVANHLLLKGWEIGLHSSFNAYKSKKSFESEKFILENTFNTKVVGNRHHYWHLNQEKPYETCKIHQEVGFLYDSSLAFEKHSGFRNGVSSPFCVFDPENKKEIDIIQIPPCLMDDHLFGYAQNTSFSNYKEHIDSLIDSVYMHEGLFMTDFHVRVLNETFFPEWGNAYKYILMTFKNRGGVYNSTPHDIASHWKNRLESIRQFCVDEVN